MQAKAGEAVFEHQPSDLGAGALTPTLLIANHYDELCGPMSFVDTTQAGVADGTKIVLLVDSKVRLILILDDARINVFQGFKRSGPHGSEKASHFEVVGPRLKQLL